MDHLNQKELKVKKLWEKGIHRPSDIARKAGYGGALEEGIKFVEATLRKLNLK